jgi:hypothetical protein
VLELALARGAAEDDDDDEEEEDEDADAAGFGGNGNVLPVPVLDANPWVRMGAGAGACAGADDAVDEVEVVVAAEAVVDVAALPGDVRILAMNSSSVRIGTFFSTAVLCLLLSVTGRPSSSSVPATTKSVLPETLVFT